MSIIESIRTFVEQNKQNILNDIETLVNIEGHYTEKEYVEQVRDWVRHAFEQEGFTCHTEEVAENRCGLLIGTLGDDRPGKPVLFSGHMDTVFHRGEFGTAAPFHSEESDSDILRGPGVHDMKSGIIISLYVVRCLNELGWKERPVKILFVGEEESDHIGSNAQEKIVANSRGALCAFNMESGNAENKICIGRKSQLTYEFSVTGKGGHAGNDYRTGKNAINEAVFKIAKIIELENWDKGTTVCPSIIKGGTHNSAIPDHCDVTVDIRVDSEEEMDRIQTSMREILESSIIDGTKTSFKYELSRYYPYRETEQIAKLHSFLNGISRELGYGEFGKFHAGGTADSGNIAYAGVPVLCSMGIRGGFDHSRDEYAVLSSAYERIEILTLAVTRLEEVC